MVRDGPKLARVYFILTAVAVDLYTLPDRHSAIKLADRVDTHFYKRCSPEKRPKHLRDQLAERGQPAPDIGEKDEKIEEKQQTSNAPSVETATQSKDEKTKELPNPYDESAFKAIYFGFFTRIWISGLLGLISGVLDSPWALQRWLTYYQTVSGRFRHWWSGLYSLGL
jgi:ATP-binding cassette, subfamily C (CFTR/MRP), member 1